MINFIVGHHTVAGAVMFYGIFFWETVALDVLKVNLAEMLARIVAADSHVVLAGLSEMFKLMDKCPASPHPTPPSAITWRKLAPPI